MQERTLLGKAWGVFPAALRRRCLRCSCNPALRRHRSVGWRRKAAAASSSQLQGGELPAVGIDLGTTSSVIAVVKDGKPAVLPDSQGRISLPSVVAFPEEGDPIVGWDATLPGQAPPGQTIHSVKRLIGRAFSDVAGLQQMLPFSVLPGPRGSAVVGLGKDRSRDLTPEEVSAMILRPLLDRAEASCGIPVRSAVITVPAHFGSWQREATKRAGRLAGLHHVELLQEPVAAAMAYGLGMDHEAADTVLVFDLGGGTFDVSVLDSFEGIMEVLSTGGDSLLGGDNWDEALSAWAMSQAGTAREEDAHSPGFMFHLLQSCRAAKELLSDQQSACVDVPLPGGGSKTLTLERAELEKITKPLLERMWPPMAAIAAEAMLVWDGAPSWAGRDRVQTPPEVLGSRTHGDMIDFVPDKYAPPPRRVTSVVLAGAATRMPAVLDLVALASGIRPDFRVNPEEAVALGAAVHAGLLTGQLQGGLEMMDGAYVVGQHGRATGLGPYAATDTANADWNP